MAWFLFFLRPKRWALLMVSSGMPTSASFFLYFFTCSLFFKKYVSDYRTCSAAILLITVDRNLKARTFFLLFFFKKLTCFWSKLTVQETFSRSLSPSLIISRISSMKISFRFVLICSINTSLNYSNRHLFLIY